LTLATGTLYVFLAQVLTDLVASQRESGFFAASFRVYLVVAAVPGLVVAAALPVLTRAARDDQTRLAYALDRLFATVVVGGALVALALSVGAPVALNIAAGEGFEDAAPALRIQAWALLASFAVAPASFALLSLRMHRQIWIANVLALATSATLTLALAPEVGAVGAATATVAGDTVLMLATVGLLQRARPDLRPHLMVVVKTIVALILGAGAAILSALSALPAMLVAVLVFGAAVLVSRALPSELRDLLPRR
jgi:O-antigen/teichoic acid export membrane protein